MSLEAEAWRQQEAADTSEPSAEPHATEKGPAAVAIALLIVLVGGFLFLLSPVPEILYVVIGALVIAVVHLVFRLRAVEGRLHQLEAKLDQRMQPPP